MLRETVLSDRELDELMLAGLWNVADLACLSFDTGMTMSQFANMSRLDPQAPPEFDEFVARIARVAVLTVCPEHIAVAAAIDVP